MSDGAGKYERLMKAAIENVSQSFFDEYEKSNAEFRTRAGLHMLVIREEVGDCCDWCADLADTYDYENAPKEVWQRHAHCRCMVITRTEKGTYQDAWSRKEYQSQREARIAREEELLTEQGGEYYGVPKTWNKRTDQVSGDELLTGTNPGYRNRGRNPFDDQDQDYNMNCANCVPAYEMRCRGYNVVAQPYSQNKSLAHDPFSAWKNAKPLSTDRFESIVSFVKAQEDGARIQIAVDFPKSIWGTRNNHTFVAEKNNGECIFKDPQAGVIIQNIESYFQGFKEAKYLRIDKLEITDRGVSACMGIKT